MAANNAPTPMAGTTRCQACPGLGRDNGGVPFGDDAAACTRSQMSSATGESGPGSDSGSTGSARLTRASMKSMSVLTVGAPFPSEGR